MDPRDTYPDDNRVRMKNPTLIPTSTGAREISIPSAVFIPFPPLKFTKIEKVCPITALNPAMIFRTVMSSKGVWFVNGRFE